MKTFVLLTFLSLAAGESLVDEYFDTLEKFRPDGMLLMSGADGDKMQRKRFHVFKQFKDNIDRINGDDSIPFTATVNQFSVLTEAERKGYTGLNVSMFFGDENELPNAGPSVQSNSLPDYIDWVSRGAQPPIKNQGNCGACWAFAGISAIEASYYQTTGDLVSFSDQEILDCGYESRWGSDGCGGGWLNAPVNYVKQAKRLASNRDNKYMARDSRCSYSRTPNSLKKAIVLGFKTSKGDRDLMAVVSRAVVSVAMKVTNSFHVYSNGIFKDVAGCRGQKVDHAVSVVGYGKSNGRNYWRVRNSWGDTWGDNGYVKMCRDTPNNCMISDHVYQTSMMCKGAAGNCNPPKFDEQEQEKQKDNNNDRDDNSSTKCANIKADNFCNRYKPFCKLGNTFKGKRVPASFAMRMIEICPKTCGACNGNDDKKKSDDGSCPSGTVRCSDGYCKHEHMCH